MHHPPFHTHDAPPFPEIDPASWELFRTFKRTLWLNRRLMRASAQDMHPAQAVCLMTLSHHDGVRQTDLAEGLHVSPPTVTTMLKKMESAGLISRRIDESDSRVTRVFLTESGREAATRMRKAHAEAISRSFGALGPADRAALQRLLDKLNDRLAASIEAGECGDVSDLKGDE